MVTERFPIYAGGEWVPGPAEMDAYDAGQKEGATKVLAGVKAAADRLGVVAETVHVPDAQPAEAIVSTAKERQCNLIVMASHGRRGLRRLLLGSQTSEVLVSSAVPVLVVR
jgi:nucleotide-binding universal stress UspA family protein